MNKKNRGKALAPVQILAIGFVILICLGTILLHFPVATVNGVSTPIVDCFFTSTSAVCVTGLVTVDTAAHWSYFGKTVIICLIEIGGLGFMAFATLLAILLGKRITLKERLIMREAMNSFNIQGIVRMARYILAFTFIVEGAGAILLSIQFIPKYGVLKGIYFSIFHSISAFCNAGFDLTGKSLVPFQNNSMIIFTISALVIIGGLGFTVWAEIYHYKGSSKMKKMSLHSKMVITMTILLLVVGTILMFLFEMHNPNTIQNMSLKDKFLNSFFASVTPRTAGFNALSTSDMSTAGRFLTIILMFIGGSPGSTAGGVKTATMGVIILTIISVVRGREETEVYKRRLSKEIVYRAFAIVIISLTIVITVTMLLSITEKHTTLNGIKVPFEYFLYEATSAFGTVGLTLGLTAKLSTFGKIIIALTMYIGRVGPLTLALALAKKKKNTSNKIKYPEGKVLVG